MPNRGFLPLLAATFLLAALSHHPAQADFVFFAEAGFGDTISKYSTTDSTHSVVASHPSADPRAIAVDHVNRKVYYGYSNSIGVVNFDGTGRSDVLAVGNGISALDLDQTTGRLYFATTSGTVSERQIKSVLTDGTGLTTIHTNSSLAGDAFVTTNRVGNMVVDSDNGRLYWTADDGGNGGRTALNSSSLTGASVTHHWRAASRASAINKMDIDLDTSLLYYTVGSSTNEVRRSNLDNSSLETLVSGVGRPAALGLDLTNDKIYFSVAGTLYKSNLDGSSLSSSTLSLSSLYSVQDIEFSSAVPEPSAAAFLATILTLGAFSRRRRKQQF